MQGKTLSVPRAACSHALQRRSVRSGVAPRPHGLEALDLLGLDTRVDLHDGDRRRLLREGVEADDEPLSSLDLELVLVGRALDLALRVALLDRRDHSAHLVDARDVLPGQLLEARRQATRRRSSRRARRRSPRRRSRRPTTCCVRSAIVAASLVGRPSASSYELVWSDWQPAEHGGERLHGHARHVHERLLRRERHPGGLAVEAQRARAVRLRAEALAHDALPHAPRGAELRDLLDEVVVHVEEERELRAERVDVEARVDRGLHVRDAVGERERQLLRCVRARLADVIAADGDRVPAGHLAGAPREHVGDEPDRGPRRVDVRPARDVLLEDVVLHRAAKRAARHALLLGDGDVEAEEDGRRRVDRHRRRDLAERQALQQRAHVLDRVDGDADAADLAACARGSSESRPICVGRSKATLSPV